MNKQTTKQGSIHAKELSADLSEFMRRTDALVGTRTSFQAEFCMRSHRDEKFCYQTQADYALAMLSHYMKGQVVSSALNAPTGDTLPVEPDHGVGPGRRSDLALLPSPLDDASYGDQDRLDVITHFYGIASRPLDFQSFSRTFLQVTDRLSAAPFHTSDFTGLTARVLLEDHLAPANPLAFALHCSEIEWMNRGGRTNGRVNAETYWSLRTFRDMIIWQFLDRDLGLDRTTPVETWIEQLTDVAQIMIEDGIDVAANLAPSCRYADFGHIGGHSYTKDFGTNLEILQEMAGALKNASCEDADEYWTDPKNVTLVRDLIQEILEVERIAKGIHFEPVQANFYATFKVMFDGQAYGMATDWNNSPGTTTAPQAGSLIRVGDYADSATDANELVLIAASMIRRRQAG